VHQLLVGILPTKELLVCGGCVIIRWILIVVRVNYYSANSSPINPEHWLTGHIQIAVPDHYPDIQFYDSEKRLDELQYTCSVVTL